MNENTVSREQHQGHQLIYQKRLIAKVKKHRVIYDPTHAGFSSIDKRQHAWQEIARELESSADFCRNTWVNLRYRYQQYVRKLRKYLRQGNKGFKRRPVMEMENDLLFLWRFIKNRCDPVKFITKVNVTSPMPSAKEPQEDDVILLEDDEPVIVIEDDESSTNLEVKEYPLKPETICLLELLREYPELYDTTHRYYNDYRRRGTIWSAVANELKEKATKLMKLWFHVQARFEWEVNNTDKFKKETKLQKILEYLKPHCVKNPNTIYKQSFYAKNNWQDPIEQFKNICNLLKTLRSFPKIVMLSDDELLNSSKSVEYIQSWEEIGEERGIPAGQCEHTWLILRSFYRELVNMRKNSYQLQDKWYFESIITELFEHCTTSNSLPSERSNVLSDKNSRVPFTVQSPLQRTIVDPTREEFNTTPSASNKPLKRHMDPIHNTNQHSLSFETSFLTRNHISKVSPACGNSQSSPLPSPFQTLVLPTCGNPSQSPLIHSKHCPRLNSNEVIIELISSPSGNKLVIQGPPLRQNYMLTMKTTAKFIREVMAIPLLHNKDISPSATNMYWEQISKKFLIPTYVCKACWNFLLKNFKYFDQIAPMSELMKPFKTVPKVWKPDTKLFKTFESMIIAKGWDYYQNDLPLLMEEISSDQQICSDSPTHIYETLPTSITQKFPNIHPSDIVEMYNAFRNVFIAYMRDLEYSIDNKWPFAWWYSLSKLQFLLARCYREDEPFYYIIKNKVLEEISRCQQMETKRTSEGLSFRPSSSGHIVKVELAPLVRSRSDSHPTSYARANDQWTSQTEWKLGRVRVLNSYKLIRCIRDHPNIYQSSNDKDKVEAWTKVASEMHASVTDCRLAFQRAFKEFRLVTIRDPSHRCRLNLKYYKHLSAIYRDFRNKGKLNIRTPSELNRSVLDLETDDTVFPERYVAHINMDNSQTALVLKNWSYAVGNLPKKTQQSMETDLQSLFDKYKSIK